MQAFTLNNRMSELNWQGYLTKLKQTLHEFLTGAALSWVMVPHALKQQKALEQIFMLMTVNDLMGFSLSPPLSGLSLLPFLVPQILSWHRRLALWNDGLEGVDLRHIGH